MTSRIYPLRRTRPYKSDAHLALEQDTLPAIDPFGAWKLPPPPRERVCCDGRCTEGFGCPRRPALRRRMPWPVRWPFTVALVMAAMLWVLAR